jgi:hypothetical protein
MYVPVSEIQISERLKLFRVLDLRERGNSSLDVSAVSRPTNSYFGNKSSREGARLGLGSQTKYTSNTSQTKTSRVFGTRLNGATESFDSPVELGQICLDVTTHNANAFNAETMLNDPHDDLNGIKIEVERRVT